jgi:hypothetical protein
LLANKQEGAAQQQERDEQPQGAAVKKTAATESLEQTSRGLRFQDVIHYKHEKDHFKNENIRT